MARTSKSKSIVLAPDGATTDRDPLVMKPIAGGKVVSFAEFRRWGELGEQAVRVVTRHMTAFCSLQGAKTALRTRFKLIDEECDKANLPSPRTPAELSPQVALAVVARLLEMPNWNRVNRQARSHEAYLMFQQLLPEKLAVQRRRGGVPSSQRRRWKTFKDEELDILSNIARRCIGDFLENRKWVERFKRRSRDWDLTGKLDSREKCIAYWLHVLEGKPIRRDHLESSGHRKFTTVLTAHGTSQNELYRLIYPSCEDAIPFIILLEKIFGLNLRGILDLETNCIGTAGNRDVIKYRKPRGAGDQVTPPVSSILFDEARWLINTYLELTKELRKLAHPELQKFLWLGLKRRQGNGPPVGVLQFGNSSFHRTLIQWCKKNGLPDTAMAAFTSRVRKHTVQEAYKEIAETTLQSQLDGIAAAKTRLNDKEGLLRCYAFNLVTEEDAVRAIKSVEKNLLQKLSNYGVQ
jgi:hypothetical protein